MGIYKVGEVIRRTRESLGISRKDLCDGICTTQTLCRIETGRQVPNRYNFQALMERMGMCVERYRLGLNGSMETLIEWEELNLLLASRKYEELDEKLTELEKILNVNDMVNRQFLIRMRAIVDYELGEIDVCQKRALLVEALKCTVAKYEDGILPYGVFTRNEIVLFCNIATAYREEGKLDKAIHMLRQVEKYFQNTSIDMEERSVSEVFAMSNLARYLGQDGKTIEAKQLEERLIKICIIMGKGSNLANILYNVAFEEEILKEDSLPQKHLIQAYYVAELFRDKRTINHIENHVKNTYETNFLVEN